MSIYRKLVILLFSISIPLISNPTSAEIYKWVDENGMPHYTDDLDIIPERYKESIKIYFQEAPEIKKEPTGTADNSEGEPMMGGETIQKKTLSETWVVVTLEEKSGKVTLYDSNNEGHEHCKKVKIGECHWQTISGIGHPPYFAVARGSDDKGLYKFGVSDGHTLDKAESTSMMYCTNQSLKDCEIALSGVNKKNVPTDRPFYDYCISYPVAMKNYDCNRCSNNLSSLSKEDIETYVRGLATYNELQSKGIPEREAEDIFVQFLVKEFEERSGLVANIFDVAMQNCIKKQP